MNINKLTFKRFFITATLVIASAVAGGIAQAQTVDIFFSTTGSDGQVVTGSGYGTWGSNPGTGGGGPGMLINFTDVKYGANSSSLATVTGLTNSSSNIGDVGQGQYLYLNIGFYQNSIWYNDQAVIHAMALNSGDSVNLGGLNTSYTGLNSSTTFYTLAGVPGAPEIDGSLAPKVGFLLGCLFLMFGRKKQNSESMMTA